MSFCYNLFAGNIHFTKFGGKKMKVTFTIVEVFESNSFTGKNGETITIIPFEVKELKALNGHHGYEFNTNKPIPAGSKKATAELIPVGNNEFKLGKWEFI